MSDDRKKARLEEIHEELTAILCSVGKHMNTFRTIRNAARGDSQEVPSDAQFFVSLDGNEPIEIPAPDNLSEELLETLMGQQGGLISSIWTSDIKNLVDEAAGICKQAEERTE
tara:strand:+ start:1158 stop:1496 length:339 start_codon:yes stop_codon:yes gene_type:complete